MASSARSTADRPPPPGAPGQLEGPASDLVQADAERLQRVADGVLQGEELSLQTARYLADLWSHFADRQDSDIMKGAPNMVSAELVEVREFANRLREKSAGSYRRCRVGALSTAPFQLLCAREALI
jgi:hypothetical protein